MTREIDNFFPGLFDYFNIRVYDEEDTDLLKYWDNTFKYITKARQAGSKVLVHCKMGVSRSASVVIAYAMKANNWDFERALRHVKEKRSCIKPNKGFSKQLETYQGILDASRNKEKLQRSKSETNLKSSAKDARLLPGSEPTPLIQALNGKQRSVYSTYRRYQTMSCKDRHQKRLDEGAEEPQQKKKPAIMVTSAATTTTASVRKEEHKQTLTEFLRQNETIGEVKPAAAVSPEEKHRQMESNRLFMKNLNSIVRAKKEQQRKYIRNAEREESLKTRPRSWSQQLGNIMDGVRVGAYPMAPMRQLSQSLENLLDLGRDFNASSSSNNSSSGNNSDSSNNEEGKSKADSKARRARTSWKFSKTTKTVRMPCSNGQNYSVSQNKIVHLTPESTNNSFLAHFGQATTAGSTRQLNVPSTGCDLPEKLSLVSSVRLIVNEIESTKGVGLAENLNNLPNLPPVAMPASGSTGPSGHGTMSRGQRDKKAMSLNLTGLAVEAKEALKMENKGVSKLIIKCDSSPIINVHLRGAAVVEEAGGKDGGRASSNPASHNNPTVIAISKTGTVSIEGGVEAETSSNFEGSEKKKIRLEPDAFSKTVDRVFDREEKKQARQSVLVAGQTPPISCGGVTVTTAATTLNTKDCLISRQSSWSSVDSACVMGGYPSESNLRDLPSRHSSWGSGDTSRTTPSRNSSWGSYDMRTNPMPLPRNCPEEENNGELRSTPAAEEDVPWHPGTVRRTRQKIEEREKSKSGNPVRLRHLGKSASAANASNLSATGGAGGHRSLSEEALLAKAKRNTICGGTLLICPPAFNDQLSVSAPSSSTSNSSCCSTYTAVNLRGGDCGGCDGVGDEDDIDDDQHLEGVEFGAPPAAVTGMVQNLKMNFEMNLTTVGGGVGSQLEEGELKPVTCRSLPSSPVAAHHESKLEGFLINQQRNSHSHHHQGQPVRTKSSNLTHHRQQPSHPQSMQSSSEEEDQELLLLQRVEKKNVRNLVGKYETTKVQLRSPETRGMGGAGHRPMRQRPKSQIITDRRTFGGTSSSAAGGLFNGPISATMPNSPAQRKTHPFTFNGTSNAAFQRPLMMNHNKISKGSHFSSIYNDNGGGGGTGRNKHGAPTSPRPPPVPSTGSTAAGGGGSTTNSSQQRGILGNKLNLNNNQEGTTATQGSPNGGAGGAGITSGGGGKGFCLKKTVGQQQQGKTHPLTKLTSLAFRQH